MLIVVASMERELAGLRSQLSRGWSPEDVGSQPEGNQTISVNLGVVGIGTQAGVGLRSIFLNNNGLSGRGLQRPVGLLLLGVTGAVVPGLETGDLVLSSRYYRPHLDEGSPQQPLEKETRDSANPDEIPVTFLRKSEAKTDFLAPDPRLWQWAMAAGRNMDKPVVYGDSLTVSDLVTAPSDKRAIERRYPVSIVNMEDYWGGVGRSGSRHPLHLGQGNPGPGRPGLAGLFVQHSRFPCQSICRPGGHAVAAAHLGRPVTTDWNRPACPNRLRSELPDPSCQRHVGSLRRSHHWRYSRS